MDEAQKTEIKAINGVAGNTNIQNQSIISASDDKKSSGQKLALNKEHEQKKLSLYEMEKKLLETNSFIVINNLVYHYDEKAHYYKLVDQDDVISLYRRCVDLELHGASSLSKYKDLHKIIQTDPDLRRNTIRYKQTYCALRNAIYIIDDQGELKTKEYTPETITFTCLNASYSKNKDCPVFRKFIDDITGGRVDLKERLLMALGYLLVETQKRKIFLSCRIQA